MDALVELSWRIYPAAVLIAAGCALALLGVARGVGGLRLPIRHPDKAVSVMRGFRLAVIGLAVAGLAAAWAWHLVWLLVLALAIGGEETLESSMHIYALTRGRDLRLRAPFTPRTAAARHTS
jgi:hypothetical protein